MFAKHRRKRLSPSRSVCSRNRHTAYSEHVPDPGSSAAVARLPHPRPRPTPGPTPLRAPPRSGPSGRPRHSLLPPAPASARAWALAEWPTAAVLGRSGGSSVRLAAWRPGPPPSQTFLGRLSLCQPRPRKLTRGRAWVAPSPRAAPRAGPHPPGCAGRCPPRSAARRGSSRPSEPRAPPRGRWRPREPWPRVPG